MKPGEYFVAHRSRMNGLIAGTDSPGIAFYSEHAATKSELRAIAYIKRKWLLSASNKKTAGYERCHRRLRMVRMHSPKGEFHRACPSVSSLHDHHGCWLLTTRLQRVGMRIAPYAGPVPGFTPHCGASSAVLEPGFEPGALETHTGKAVSDASARVADAGENFPKRAICLYNARLMG